MTPTASTENAMRPPAFRMFISARGLARGCGWPSGSCTGPGAVTTADPSAVVLPGYSAHGTGHLRGSQVACDLVGIAGFETAASSSRLRAQANEVAASRQERPQGDRGQPDDEAEPARLTCALRLEHLPGQRRARIPAG